MKILKPDLKSSERQFSDSVEISDLVEYSTSVEISMRFWNFRTSQNLHVFLVSWPPGIQISCLYCSGMSFKTKESLPTQFFHFPAVIRAYPGHNRFKSWSGRDLAGKWPGSKIFWNFFFSLERGESQLSNAPSTKSISCLDRFLDWFNFFLSKVTDKWDIFDAP